MLRLINVSRLMWRRWLKKARLKNQLWRWCCCPDTLSIQIQIWPWNQSLLMDFSGPVLMQHSFDKCGLKINFSVSYSWVYVICSLLDILGLFLLLKNRVTRIICKSIQYAINFIKFCCKASPDCLNDVMVRIKWKKSTN